MPWGAGGARVGGIRGLRVHCLRPCICALLSNRMCHRLLHPPGVREDWVPSICQHPGMRPSWDLGTRPSVLTVALPKAGQATFPHSSLGITFLSLFLGGHPRANMQAARSSATSHLLLQPTAPAFCSPSHPGQTVSPVGAAAMAPPACCPLPAAPELTLGT